MLSRGLVEVPLFLWTTDVTNSHHRNLLRLLSGKRARNCGYRNWVKEPYTLNPKLKESDAPNLSKKNRMPHTAISPTPPFRRHIFDLAASAISKAFLILSPRCRPDVVAGGAVSSFRRKLLFIMHCLRINSVVYN